MSASMRSNCWAAACPPGAGRVHPGPERRYEVIEPVVRQIWLSAEQPCGKRLVPILRQWLPFYELRHGGVESAAAPLGPANQRGHPGSAAGPGPGATLAGRGRGGTKPGSLLRSEIPLRTGTWDLTRPGYLEADSVAHCGGSLAGDFIWSLTYTDILSGWTEGGAVWNRGAGGVLAATREVEERLPFALLGFDSDNGGEFLNHHLWAYMRERQAPVEFTRSRPYHSDDNAHVEQKNWTWARQLLGYGRLENPGVGGADQRAVPGGVGAVAELFSALFETGAASGARAVIGASATSCPRRLTSGSARRAFCRSKRGAPCGSVMPV